MYKLIPLAVVALITTGSQAVRIDGIWDDAAGGVDTADYASDTPKAYMEKEKPKIDYKAIEKRKKEAQALMEKEKAEQDELKKDIEDMDIELFTFSKTLKPSSLHKALSIKEKLENKGHAPAHFRVAVHNLWSKGFKHDSVANYAFVKEKLQDIDVAEKNLNRNIDSKSQLDIFLKTAEDVKKEFLKRYGEHEW